VLERFLAGLRVLILWRAHPVAVTLMMSGIEAVSSMFDERRSWWRLVGVAVLMALCMVPVAFMALMGSRAATWTPPSAMV
jgi:uncharacterized membrane protein